MSGFGKISLLAVVAGFCGLSFNADAQYFDTASNIAYQKANLRHYYLYPYQWSTGPRYDPYWSYNSSYFPETYNGDGSYYGLGYSGYYGDGWYGSYWYW